uniref:Reverse transcriptase domain-containing protein n=1 Tax=Tanacetum cinerariifolium TaxID=118510 RepID=A0A6L2KFP6_TANCI|nr:reverse transcriptase domain-containing protein [Tanacetum cinerariifolium]
MNGRDRSIAPVNSQATDFELKNHMIQQVQNSFQFHGLPGDDANKHLDKFLTITQSMKQNEEMALKFLSKYFPPSMVTKLRNDISNFRQLLDESLLEAWEHYKLLIDRCSNHNMLPVTQIDMLYNGSTLRHHDTINAAAGGTFMKRRPKECYDLIENMIAHHNDWDTSAHRGESSSSITSSSSELLALTQQMTEMRKDMLHIYRSNQQVNYMTPSCETCGRPHSYYECQAVGGYTQDVYATTGTYNSGGNTYQPQVQPSPASTSELPPAPVSSLVIPERNPHQPLIPYPSRLNKEKLQDKADIQIYSFLQMFKKLYFNLSFSKSLAHMPKYAKMIKDLLTNKEKLLELKNTPLNEKCSAVLLKKLPEKLRDARRFLILCDFYGLESCTALADLGASINLMPLFVWKKLSLPELTHTRLTLELATRTVAYLAGRAEDVFVQVGNPTPSFNLMVASLSLSLTPFGDSDFILEEIDTFLASDDSTSPDVDDGTFDPEGDIYLIKELLNNEILNDLPLPLPDLPSHIEYAFLEGTSKLPVIISKDLKREEKEPQLKILKSHKRAIAWKISDIKGIDPNFCTYKILMEDDFKPAVQHLRRSLGDLDSFRTKERGMMVITNENNELIPTRLVTEKTTFTCPYGTFAYRKMPFGLCNALGTFQRCMVAIFHDMIEKTMEVFMDDFLEKCHFMVKEGIVFGHKIFKNGIEVDRAKVDVITKLPPPTTVKGIRSFLGHADYYKRFIQDFSKIARLMTHLLEKDTHFFFSSECQSSFEILKKKLTEAPILVSLNWDLPFEIMYDASDFAVGVVLGQRKDKYFRPIHYARKTLSDAQTN